VARLVAAGAERIYQDVMSGARASRPEWDRMVDALRPGDVLVVVRLDRIGRSVKNLIDVVTDLAALDADLVVLDQAIDTTTPAGKLIFHVLAAIAEFERDLIRERTADGLAAAKARGAKLGRPSKLTAAQVRTVRDMAAIDPATGRRRHPVSEIASLVGVHSTTLYDYLARQAP
jgi:DNA invertase Pin-like site-specific DNA recombinase